MRLATTPSNRIFGRCRHAHCLSVAAWRSQHVSEFDLAFFAAQTTQFTETKMHESKQECNVAYATITSTEDRRQSDKTS